MTGTLLIEYEQMPAVAPAYLKAATTLGGGLSDGQTIPDMQARVPTLTGAQGKLEGYRDVCGFARSAHLPLTYPHVLAFPLQMAVLTHADFPLKLLGLVHVRNSISQYRRIGNDEPLALTVSVGGHREVHNGIEFDMHTRYEDAQEACLWESASTMLARAPSKGSKSGGRKPKPELPEGLNEAGEWLAPADIGRRYARFAGDYNPIHLSALSAKLFGFPGAIAHGMWLKARCAAEFEPLVDLSACRIEVAFKRPVLLPSNVKLHYGEQDRGMAFALARPDGSEIHMRGQLEYLSG